ncbi:MAG: A24 family peptidase [Pseudomonadota bacterium]
MALLFETSPWLFACVAATFGLLVGSFLNVVIYRVPVMMQREWDSQFADWQREQQDAKNKQATETTPSADVAPFNLATPASTCPKCDHKIRAIENIPLLSYLFLRGRCSGCSTKISLRYPFVEFLTGAASLAVALRFGPGLEAIAGIVLTWFLIALSGIDIDHQLLPDNMTLPLLWIGLTLSLFPVPDTTVLFISPQDAIIGALAGYLVLWLVFHAFRLLTGKHGMGYGDFKLLAALGAWLGWAALPLIIILSALSGALFGIAMIVTGQQQRGATMPFGPWLAIAGWLFLMFGNTLNTWYLATLGL